MNLFKTMQTTTQMKFTVYMLQILWLIAMSWKKTADIWSMMFVAIDN